LFLAEEAIMDTERIMAWGLEKMKFTDETPLETGYRYYHGLRTARIAISLADGLNLAIDRDVLFAGGFLHDVGKAGYRGPDHGARGEAMIRSEIPSLFADTELDAVCSIVRNHYHRPNSRHYCGKEKPSFPAPVLLVQDADTLDHFGGNALWLAFRWAVTQGRTPSDALEFHREQDATWRREALEGLNFSLSRRELEARIARIDAFFALWEEEQEGKLTILCSGS
jgi:HD superfamily phosphodiesterase